MRVLLIGGHFDGIWVSISNPMETIRMALPPEPCCSITPPDRAFNMEFKEVEYRHMHGTINPMVYEII